MHAVIKPWPFRGWAMNVIGKIYPTSSKRHNFILVASDYFKKWVDVEPLVSVTQDVVIRFIRHNIIYRFNILESITTNQGTMLAEDKVSSFIQHFGIKLIDSTPYYA